MVLRVENIQALTPVAVDVFCIVLAGMLAQLLFFFNHRASLGTEILVLMTYF